MTRRARLAVLAAGLALAGCESLAPLRDPPGAALDAAAATVTTRAEALARLGRPDEVRASDVGPVLVYRRVTVVDANQSRYFGLDRGSRHERFERLLLHLDGEGRVVRREVERD